MSTVKYNGDPHAYRKMKEGTHYKCFCLSVENREDGIYNCTFSKREDHLKSDITKGKVHICDFQKQEYSRSIESYFQKEKNDDAKITDSYLLTQLAILVGRRNLSLETGACKEMNDLMRSCILYGMQNSSSNIDDIFGNISVDTIRKYVISSSIEVNKIQFEKFSKLPFVGVSCDEGSTRSIHNLDFVLENPLFGLKSYPCFTTIMKKGKAADYCEHLAHGIFFISNNNINIGSITVDGNLAQLKALSFEWNDSLHHRYIDEKGILKHLIINKCLCHRIHNCYKSAYSHNEELKQVVDYIRGIAIECRANINHVLDICPSVQLTRWVIDYDICCFIINHAPRIQKFRDIETEPLLQLKEVLSILKSLINIFENEKTPHFRAFRTIEEAIGALESLEEENPYALCIKMQLYKYTIGSKDAGLWMLSYILTPSGRNDFSKRVNKRTLPKNKDFKSFFSPGKIKQLEDIDAITEASLEAFKIEENDEESIDSSKYLKSAKERKKRRRRTKEKEDEGENDDKDEEHKEEEGKGEEEEEEKEEEEEEEQGEEANDDDDESEASTIKNSDRLCLNQAQNYLVETLEHWGISERSRTMVMEEFNSFVQNNEDVYADQTLSNGDYFWENIKFKNPIWDTISEIAMRLHCSPCSEASCERTISSQRLVLTARRMNSKKQLLDARLTLLRGLNVK